MDLKGAAERDVAGACRFDVKGPPKSGTVVIRTLHAMAFTVCKFIRGYDSTFAFREQVLSQCLTESGPLAMGVAKGIPRRDIAHGQL